MAVTVVAAAVAAVVVVVVVVVDRMFVSTANTNAVQLLQHLLQPLTHDQRGRGARDVSACTAVADDSDTVVIVAVVVVVAVAVAVVVTVVVVVVPPQYCSVPVAVAALSSTNTAEEPVAVSH